MTMSKLEELIELIGLPRYPLGHPGLKRVFRPETADPIKDDGLAALMRQVHKGKPFKPGLCYSNVERVILNAVNNGWKNVLPYSGWVIIGDSAPVHHAWAVHQNQIIDLSSIRVPEPIIKAMDERLRTLSREREKESVLKSLEIKDPAAREAFMQEAWVQFQIDYRNDMNATFKTYEDGDIIENRGWGLISYNYTYVGCPCIPNDARAIFNRWHAKYGAASNHEGPGKHTITQMLDLGMEDAARKKLSGNSSRTKGDK
jgi:hypothetical protein